ncbi:hypothetical protein DITRI_Ditri02bG0195700 [Diplodiscus trichospermus]
MGFLFCILVGFFFTVPFVGCSRGLPQSSQPAPMTVLDVAEALEKTKNVLLFDPAKKPAFSPVNQSLSASTSSSLFLQIQSRPSIRKSSHLDYKSLTLSRFEYDLARVRLLTTRLGMAINGISRLDIKQLDNRVKFRVEDIKSPVVSGMSEESGEYFSRVGIGKPPSQVYMVVDTGSDVSWVQCTPCFDCYRQVDPIFEPASSSSYSHLSCETQQCRYLRYPHCRIDGNCVYEVSYGDGSSTVGDFVTETITLGSDSIDNVAIGCGHDNDGLFIGAGGLLGLGGGPLSFTSQLNASSFSYCLVDHDSDSVSTLEFDSALPSNAITAPLLRNHYLDTFYYLGLTGISVGGEILPIPESAFQMDESGLGGIIIDSGTAVTRLPNNTYNTLRDAFVKGTKNLPPTDSVALFDTCYDLSTRSSVLVPRVSFHFPDGKVLPLPAKNYMIPVDSAGTFCLAFAPTSYSLAIIGNTQQQGIRVGFDLRNSLIGFVPNQC